MGADFFSGEDAFPDLFFMDEVMASPGRPGKRYNKSGEGFLEKDFLRFYF